jgi:hypothetical protein
MTTISTKREEGTSAEVGVPFFFVPAGSSRASASSLLVPVHPALPACWSQHWHFQPSAGPNPAGWITYPASQRKPFVGQINTIPAGPSASSRASLLVPAIPVCVRLDIVTIYRACACVGVWPGARLMAEPGQFPYVRFKHVFLRSAAFYRVRWAVIPPHTGKAVRNNLNGQFL